MKTGKALNIPLWRRFACISGISAAAVVGGVMLVQHALVAPVGTVATGNAGEVPSEKAETPVIPGEKRELLRTPTLLNCREGMSACL